MILAGAIAAIGVVVAITVAAVGGVLFKLLVADLMLALVTVGVFACRRHHTGPVFSVAMPLVYGSLGGAVGLEASTMVCWILTISLGAVGFGIGFGIDHGLRQEPPEVRRDRLLRCYQNAIKTGRWNGPLMIMGGVLFGSIVAGRFTTTLEAVCGLSAAVVMITGGIAALWWSLHARPPKWLEEPVPAHGGDEPSDIAR